MLAKLEAPVGSRTQGEVNEIGGLETFDFVDLALEMEVPVYRSKLQMQGDLAFVPIEHRNTRQINEIVEQFDAAGKKYDHIVYRVVDSFISYDDSKVVIVSEDGERPEEIVALKGNEKILEGNGGNTHMLVPEGDVKIVVEKASDLDAMMIILVGKDAVAWIHHPEHAALGLGEGCYIIRRQQEIDLEEMYRDIRQEAKINQRNLLGQKISLDNEKELERQREQERQQREAIQAATWRSVRD